MPGPLPKSSGQRRRVNAPTIPTTNLPASGRVGPVPKPPRWVSLGPAGLAWWRWAWRTPQAVAWSAGHEAALARRAELEDDVAALARVDGLDLSGVDDREGTERVVSALARLASGKLSLLKEMRELDDRFGLTPKAMAALRWTIVTDEEKKPAAQPATVRRLRAVDPAAS